MPIPTAKRSFLERYNDDRSAVKAASRAIAAASQHNSLYLGDISVTGKARVRTTWSGLLEIIADKYGNPVSEAEYLTDIQELKRAMNADHAPAFRRNPHPQFNYSPGFRISHAQKSLSVYLKHLWCLGEITVPPQCPVDALILKKAGLRYPRTKWAYIDSIAEHQAKIEVLNRHAAEAGLSLAEWELLQF
ncbi:MAG: hypothetical protein U0984_12030 [Prosthecobacter sp.]|nr:hypothetical protein [Prosthecobacter sp.]